MTPAVKFATKLGYEYKLHEYSHDPRTDSYGEEAADKLGLKPERVFKTLVVKLSNGKLAVAVLPVNRQMSLKKVAHALGSKKAKMADPREVQAATGYVLGGVSPLGQAKQLQTAIDTRANLHSTIFVSAGRRGLEIELKVEDLVDGCRGTLADVSAGE